jgi:hypothetical protein
MPLFGGRRDGDADDDRPRHYVLTGEPIVTADSYVVLVDLEVRYDQVAQPDGPGLGWKPEDEVAVHAVAVATLRVEGEGATREELVAERARLAEPASRALAFAPVAAGFRPTLVSLEVRAHEEGSRGRHEFRVAG